MEDLPKKPPNLFAKTMYNYRRFNGDDENGGEGGDECDAEAWEGLSKSFREVQSVLDRNRALIQQVNENHQSKIHDNLVKNVALIREINDNISRVTSIYSHLSADFFDILHQRRAKVKSAES